MPVLIKPAGGTLDTPHPKNLHSHYFLCGDYVCFSQLELLNKVVELHNLAPRTKLKKKLPNEPSIAFKEKDSNGYRNYKRRITKIYGKIAPRIAELYFKELEFRQFNPDPTPCPWSSLYSTIRDKKNFCFAKHYNFLQTKEVYDGRTESVAFNLYHQNHTSKQDAKLVKRLKKKAKKKDVHWSNQVAPYQRKQQLHPTDLVLALERAQDIPMKKMFPSVKYGFRQLATGQTIRTKMGLVAQKIDKMVLLNDPQFEKFLDHPAMKSLEALCLGGSLACPVELLSYSEQMDLCIIGRSVGRNCLVGTLATWYEVGGHDLYEDRPIHIQYNSPLQERLFNRRVYLREESHFTLEDFASKFSSQIIDVRSIPPEQLADYLQTQTGVGERKKRSTGGSSSSKRRVVKKVSSGSNNISIELVFVGVLCGVFILMLFLFRKNVNKKRKQKTKWMLQNAQESFVDFCADRKSDVVGFMQNLLTRKVVIEQQVDKQEEEFKNQVSAVDEAEEAASPKIVPKKEKPLLFSKKKKEKHFLLLTPSSDVFPSPSIASGSTPQMLPEFDPIVITQVADEKVFEQHKKKREKKKTKDPIVCDGNTALPKDPIVGIAGRNIDIAPAPQTETIGRLTRIHTPEFKHNIPSIPLSKPPPLPLAAESTSPRAHISTKATRSSEMITSTPTKMKSSTRTTKETAEPTKKVATPKKSTNEIVVFKPAKLMEKNSQGWSCLTCTLVNTNDAYSCVACESIRGQATAKIVFDVTTRHALPKEEFPDISLTKSLGKKGKISSTALLSQENQDSEIESGFDSPQVRCPHEYHQKVRQEEAQNDHPSQQEDQNLNEYGQRYEPQYQMQQQHYQHQHQHQHQYHQPTMNADAPVFMPIPVQTNTTNTSTYVDPMSAAIQYVPVQLVPINFAQPQQPPHVQFIPEQYIVNQAQFVTPPINVAQKFPLPVQPPLPGNPPLPREPPPPFRPEPQYELYVD